MSNDTCPKCKGHKIETISKWRGFFALFFTGWSCLIFGLIIWPLLIIAIPALLGSMAALFAKKVNKCHDCRKIWVWKKEVKAV